MNAVKHEGACPLVGILVVTLRPLQGLARQNSHALKIRHATIHIAP